MPLFEVEKRSKEHTESEGYRAGHRAWDRAAEQLQNIRLLSSAMKFLGKFGPSFPADLTGIADEKGPNLPELSKLSPRLRDALKRSGWDEPAPMRDF